MLRGQGVTTYQVIDVSKNQLVYRSYLAEKQPGATTDLPLGAVYDTFTVTKSDAGEKWVTEDGVTPPEPEVPAKVELDAASVKAGGTVTVSGSGFAEGAQLRFELRSDPVQLGTATAGTDGSFQRTLTIPANTPAGAHTLAVIRADGTEITTSLTVTAAAGGGNTTPGTNTGGSTGGDLATTGADSAPYVIAAVVLLAAGLGLFAMRRRRQHAEADAE